MGDRVSSAAYRADGGDVRRRQTVLPLESAIVLRSWLTATAALVAAVPWYTLHLFPVLTIGSAKINVLDIGVAGAVCLALPAVVAGVRAGRPVLLCVCAFVGYMIIPFVHGLGAPQSAFFAIRESRALLFYLLALVFAAGNLRPADYRVFARAYVGGCLLAVVAVFAHVRWMLPIPGYPDVTWSAVSLYSAGSAGLVYVEWTVLVVAFFLSMVGALTTSGRVSLLGWTLAMLAIAWYVFATAERFIQVLVILTAAIPLWTPMFRGIRLRRVAAAAAVLTVIVGVGVSAVAGPYWILHPARTSLSRWSNLLKDDSLSFRLREAVAGFPRFAQHPVTGLGLGSLILLEDPHNPGHPWPYASSGYVFLLYKTGLVGLALYLTMAGLAITGALRHPSIFVFREPWPAGLIGFIGLALLLILNVLYPSVDTPEGAIAFSLFYGMIASQPSRSRSAEARGAVPDR